MMMIARLDGIAAQRLSERNSERQNAAEGRHKIASSRRYPAKTGPAPAQPRTIQTMPTPTMAETIPIRRIRSAGVSEALRSAS
jgi:hypothetical protein